MEYSAFEEATVPICSFVLKNGQECKNGLYIKLSEFKGGMEIQRQKVIDALRDKSCYYFYEKNKDEFCFITGQPLSFWASKSAVKAFQNGRSLADICNPKVGLQTGDVDLFVRKWFECSTENICFNNMIMKDRSVWFPYNNGGEFRKWYGNNDEVVNWKDGGVSVINHINKAGKKGARPQNRDYYFRNGATWSAISSSSFSVRLYPEGFLFSNAGMAIFGNKTILHYIVGFLNSKLAQKYLGFFNEGLNYNQGDISKLPIIISEKYINEIIALVENCEVISKTDWDAFELSWEFKKHPFVETSNVQKAFENWKSECTNRLYHLKRNEEEINRIFIDIYSLQNELVPEVENKDITIYQADLQKDIKSFISYAVGCMFGRYSLDKDGLIYGGGEWDDSQYSTFIPDKDNVIPITDEEYFEDDIVGLFVTFVKKVYGEETLEENLEFIANALGNKGNTSREIIRNYFVKDFYKDHVKTYQKRPIYWLYDSGKNDGFKALIYMHRYNEDTTGVVRVEYLHKMQKIFMNEIERMQDMVDNSANSREVAQAEKRKEKLVKQLKETKEYDEKIAHLALNRIVIDLDDGVKVNYEKIQTGQDGRKLDILGKI